VCSSDLPKTPKPLGIYCDGMYNHKLEVKLLCSII